MRSRLNKRRPRRNRLKTGPVELNKSVYLSNKPRKLNNLVNSSNGQVEVSYEIVPMEIPKESYKQLAINSAEDLFSQNLKALTKFSKIEIAEYIAKMFERYENLFAREFYIKLTQLRNAMEVEHKLLTNEEQIKVDLYRNLLDSFDCGHYE